MKGLQNFKLNRIAYKAVRQKVRNAMIQKELAAPAIINIAQRFLREKFPEAYVNLDDLCGACLFWQKGYRG